MPNRYRFDLENGQDSIRDDTGVEAENLDQALEEADEVLRDMRHSGELIDSSNWTLVIRDDGGAELKRIYL